MRLFAAIAPTDDVRDRLATLQSGLRDAKPVEWENLHLTLGFFGDVDGRRAEDLHAALSDIAAPRFDLWLDGAGAFGGDKPRQLYIAARPDSHLVRLHEKVKRAASGAGVEMEAKRFVPHVTVARLRAGRVHSAQASEWLTSASMFLAGPQCVGSFSLYRSTLGHNGPVYEELASYPLAKSTPDGEAGSIG